MNLISNMKALCDDARMLTGIAIAYGTDTKSESVRYGRAQEVLIAQDGAFSPCVRPIEADSIFDLASLTKLFTCVMAMQLVEQGRLSLNETVGSIDKRFASLRDARVGDVLSFSVCLQTDGRIDAAPTREEALRRLFAARQAQLPRIRLYSDINAMVIKYVVEQKTGMAFADAIKAYILRPLGLAQTFAQVPECEISRCVCYNYEHRIAAGMRTLRTDTPCGTVHDPKAAILAQGGADLCGHAGLFSTQTDMIRFAQALLSGELLAPDTLLSIGENRTGLDYGDGTHRQYLGYLCFTKHPNQHLSEVPTWMGENAIGLSGFTGNHIALDPRQKRFVLFLGNRCHARVSHIQLAPGESYGDYGLAPDGTGCVRWADGRAVPSSARYVYFKDAMLHTPIRARMQALGWL